MKQQIMVDFAPTYLSTGIRVERPASVLVVLNGTADLPVVIDLNAHPFLQYAFTS